MSDLNEKLNILVTTVSRALNADSSISDATTKRVIELAKKLGCQPNNKAAGLRRGRKNVGRYCSAY